MAHRMILFALVMTITHFSFSQEPYIRKVPKTQAEFMKKSKEQKIGAFILLGAGIISIAAVSSGDASFGTAGTVAVLGGAAILGSIPLFLASGRNKRKARNMSASLELHELPQTFQMASRLNYYHACSLKINLTRN